MDKCKATNQELGTGQPQVMLEVAVTQMVKYTKVDAALVWQIKSNNPDVTPVTRERRVIYL